MRALQALNPGVLLQHSRCLSFALASVSRLIMVAWINLVNRQSSQSEQNKRWIKAGLLLSSNLIITVTYFLSGRFGLSLAFLNPSASAVWPPTGFALAAV